MSTATTRRRRGKSIKRSKQTACALERSSSQSTATHPLRVPSTPAIIARVSGGYTEWLSSVSPAQFTVIPARHLVGDHLEEHSLRSAHLWPLSTEGRLLVRTQLDVRTWAHVRPLLDAWAFTRVSVQDRNVI